MKNFLDNESGVKYIKDYCKDTDFIEAVEGFFKDATEREDAIMHRTLTSFLQSVEITDEGKSTIDSVRLLDMYEEALAEIGE